jgi:hypothetical protein
MPVIWRNKLIAGRVSAGVVDDEMIEIQIQQRARYGPGARTHQGSFEPSLELSARDEAGQCIVTGLTEFLARLVQARGGACDLALQCVDASRHLADFVA